MKFAVSLMNYAKQYVGTFIAEDIVHDAFIRIYGKRMLQGADDEIKRILFTSVRNLCIDMLRHQDCVNDFNENHKMDIPESCDESNTTEDTSALAKRCGLALREKRADGVEYAVTGKAQADKFLAELTSEGIFPTHYELREPSLSEIFIEKTEGGE